jgi:hypothetical protein
MSKNSTKLASENMLKSFSLPGQKSLSKKCFALLASVVGLLSVDALALSQAAPAAVPSDEPILLAQQVNGRIAHLQCGPYDITIRFVGYASSDEYSYQTHGLFLTGGVENETGDGQSMYRFFNNDFEYRVVLRGGGSGSGSGSLMVLKYGETLLTKSCTWT